jgi:hypothetical protein
MALSWNIARLSFISTGVDSVTLGRVGGCGGRLAWESHPGHSGSHAAPVIPSMVQTLRV